MLIYKYLRKTEPILLQLHEHYIRIQCINLDTSNKLKNIIFSKLFHILANKNP